MSLPYLFVWSPGSGVSLPGALERAPVPPLSPVLRDALGLTLRVRRAQAAVESLDLLPPALAPLVALVPRVTCAASARDAAEVLRRAGQAAALALGDLYAASRLGLAARACEAVA